MHRPYRKLAVLLLAAGAAALASAQVNVPGVPLPELPRLPVGADPVTGTLRSTQSSLTEARRLRVRQLLRMERATVEADPDGQPIVRQQVGALSPTPAALERARAAGFTVLRTDSLDGLGLSLVILQVPERLSTRRALKQLRELDPEGQYDYNHLYLDAGLQSGTPAPPSLQSAAAEARVTSTVRIGLIDSGVDAAHPVLGDASIVRQGCDGEVFPASHGTAVASLLVGRSDEFESMIPGATLYAADIFCGHGGGSMGLLAIALDWMARERVAVVNISLVGAKSLLLNGLVRAMTARGFLLVAAVGNDGPTAPPLYPAAYPEVVGVTGVDAKRRVLPEALRGEQVDFAAVGAGLLVADVGGGFSEIRGTSFATPIVAALLAVSLQSPDPAKAREALALLESTAIDIGNNGVDPSYGKGLVGGEFHPGRREET